MLKMEINSKGQGATEYLIILAVIIVIALVVVGVMGWMPGVGTGITAAQSRAYWEGTYPFAIVDWKVTSTGATDAEFAIQNMTSKKITLQDINTSSGDFNTGSANLEFTAGETKTVVALTGFTCSAGQPYSLDVNINYDTQKISGLKQIGAKPLVGDCA